MKSGNLLLEAEESLEPEAALSLAAPFAVRTMGPFALTAAATGESLLPPRRKARGLLVYLALSAEGTATRERLAALLWPDRAAEQARASLRQSLADLNRLVGGEPRLVKPTRDEVSLDRDLLAIDKDRFIQTARSGDLRAIEQWLGAWNGRILDDLDGLSDSFDDWLASLRPVLELEIVNAALSAAEAGLGRADPQAAALIATRLMTIDPFNERAARLGLRASAAAGDLVAVHRLFRRFETLLREELRTAPSDETRRLYLDLVQRNVALDPLSAAEHPLRQPTTMTNAAAATIAPETPTSRRRRWPIGLGLLAVVIVGAAGMLSAGLRDRSSLTPDTAATYQAARDAANQRTRLGVFRAVSLFQQVVKRAPDYSRGWSGLAFADFLVWANPKVADDLNLGHEDWLGRMQSAADRALALDPKNGEAYMVLASAAEARNDTATMQTLVDRGIAADPTEPTLYRYKGGNLLSQGYARDALPYLRRAVRLDPSDPRAISALYSALLEAGATAEARRILDESYAKFPLYPHIWLAKFVALVGEHRYRDAEAMVLPTALQPDRTFAGSPAQLRLIVHALEAGRPHLDDAALRAPGPEGEENEAGYYLWRLALIGQRDEAFAFAKAMQVRPVVAGQEGSALRNEAGLVLESFVDPAFDRFRQDPRSMNLWVLDGTSAYWQKSGKWPDFCQRPGWPYDCKAVVARYMAEDSRVPTRG